MAGELVEDEPQVARREVAGVGAVGVVEEVLAAADEELRLRLQSVAVEVAVPPEEEDAVAGEEAEVRPRHQHAGAHAPPLLGVGAEAKRLARRPARHARVELPRRPADEKVGMGLQVALREDGPLGVVLQGGDPVRQMVPLLPPLVERHVREGVRPDLVQLAELVVGDGLVSVEGPVLPALAQRIQRRGDAQNARQGFSKVHHRPPSFIFCLLVVRYR